MPQAIQKCTKLTKRPNQKKNIEGAWCAPNHNKGCKNIGIDIATIVCVVKDL